MNGVIITNLSPKSFVHMNGPVIVCIMVRLVQDLTSHCGTVERMHASINMAQVQWRGTCYLNTSCGKTGECVTLDWYLTLIKTSGLLGTHWALQSRPRWLWCRWPCLHRGLIEFWLWNYVFRLWLYSYSWGILSSERPLLAVSIWY